MIIKVRCSLYGPHQHATSVGYFSKWHFIKFETMINITKFRTKFNLIVGVMSVIGANALKLEQDKTYFKIHQGLFQLTIIGFSWALKRRQAITWISVNIVLVQSQMVSSGCNEKIMISIYQLNFIFKFNFHLHQHQLKIPLLILILIYPIIKAQCKSPNFIHSYSWLDLVH